MRKSISCVLMIAALIGIVYTPSYAAEIEPRESYVFSSYWVMAYEGESDGEIKIAFSVTCSHFTSVIGVSSISIYRTNGTHVHTEEGTVENGLLRNGGSCAGTYIYQGVSGANYYAVVKFYGVADGITDTRTIITDTVTAPY